MPTLTERLPTWLTRLGLGAVIGVFAGVSSAAFLAALDWATDAFDDHGALLYALPVAGFAIGWAYHHRGKGSTAGNNLILDEIHEPQGWIPRRMAPFVFVATVVTHLFGGSAGREGTAIQMSGSLTDALNQRLGITGRERRLLLLAAVGGGFASVFGVPFAGVVFGLEVQAVGRLRWSALPATVVACFVGNETVHLLGIHHANYPYLDPVQLSATLVGKVLLGSVAFGLTAAAFATLTHRIKRWLAPLIEWPPWRPVAGGFAIIAMTLLVGTRAYNGLSLPLIAASLAGGDGVGTWSFALKLAFTAVTLGTGFQGGEVTPLFVIGATLGVTLGTALGIPIPLMAALGLVAVFAGATNTPIACTVMGIELFGWNPAVLFALSCTMAYLCSGGGGIYTGQRHRGWGFHHLLPSDPASEPT